MRNTFVISCPIDCYSGYSSRSRDIVKALIESDKYYIKIIPQRWGDTPQGFIKDNFQEWGFLQPYILNSNLTEQPDIFCQITVPNEATPIGKYNILITAGIETTICAPQWIEGMNKMDLILVSSTHSRKVLSNTVYTVKDKSGTAINELKLNKPIKVLFEGINNNIFNFLKPNQLKKNELYKTIDSIPESFAFLFVGHWLPGEFGHDRKNVGLLVKSFYETFKNKQNPPALILKTSGSGSSYLDRREILRKIQIIKETIKYKTLPNVYVLHGEFEDFEVNELYNHPKIKAMVNLTKGEGFGRPLLEFSLVNKPIITTNWSGHLDFLKEKYCYLIKGELHNIHPTSQVKDLLVQGAQWFNPNLDDIQNAFIDVFEKYPDWIQKSKRQGYYSRENFLYENMKTKLGSILEENIPDIPIKFPLNLPKLDIKI